MSLTLLDWAVLTMTGLAVWEIVEEIKKDLDRRERKNG